MCCVSLFLDLRECVCMIFIAYNQEKREEEQKHRKQRANFFHVQNKKPIFYCPLKLLLIPLFSLIGSNTVGMSTTKHDITSEAIQLF